jgi:hypothetical protein
MDQALWVPAEQWIESSQLHAFARRVEKRHGIAVRDVVHGRPVKNVDALLNPKALNLFKGVPALRV